MSKPIDKAILLKDVCPNCDIEVSDITIDQFKCNLHAIGLHFSPCKIEDWARCPFNPGNQKPAALKTGSTSFIDELKSLIFDSRNKFYWGCQHYLKMLKKDIDPIIGGLNLNNAGQRKEAWLKVIEKFLGEPTKGG